MQTIPVDVHRVDRAAPDLQADIERARVLANWLDAKFSIMGFRFGVDAIAGLVPGVGDAVMALAATYPIFIAERHGLGKAVQLRMALNVLIDLVPGSVPVLGDAFDVWFKANLKNLKLLEAAAEKKLRREPAAR